MFCGVPVVHSPAWKLHRILLIDERQLLSEGRHYLLRLAQGMELSRRLITDVPRANPRPPCKQPIEFLQRALPTLCYGDWRCSCLRCHACHHMSLNCTSHHCSERGLDVVPGILPSIRHVAMNMAAYWWDRFSFSRGVSEA